MDEDDWLGDHLELYAIDGLPEAERDRVERELDALGPAERAVYDARVDEVRALMHDYALRFTTAAPDTLRDRVLADFRAGHAHAPPGVPPEVPTAVSIDRARRRRRATALVAAAAVTIAAALGGGVLIGRSTAPAPQSTTTAQGAEAAAVFAAPDAVLATAALADTRGVLTVVSSRSRNQAVAAMREFAGRLPADRALQLWSVSAGGQAVSAGLFGEAGPAVIVVDGLDAASAFAVTMEPLGGSSAPTTPILGQVSV